MSIDYKSSGVNIDAHLRQGFGGQAGVKIFLISKKYVN